MVMEKAKHWIEQFLPLDRPEYAKQPEALLTDLLWRSPGSTLRTATESSNGLIDRLNELHESQKAKDKKKSKIYLLPVCAPTPAKEAEYMETEPIALDVDCSELLGSNENGLVKFLLKSCKAPTAEGARGTESYVVVQPDMIAFQNLRGFTAKHRPANLAKIIEVAGRLGGAAKEGKVGECFLHAMAGRADAREGFTGLVENLFPHLVGGTWAAYEDQSNPRPDDWTDWPGVGPVDLGTSGGESLFRLSGFNNTPFNWFWTKWQTLCDPENNWRDTLPARRFVDWATCLLRTSLALGYSWEAEFFIRVHEVLGAQSRGGDVDRAIGSVMEMGTRGTVLGTIYDKHVPATEKEAWTWIRDTLAKGYTVRQRLIDYLDKSPETVPEGQSLDDFLANWVQAIPADDLENLGSPLLDTSSAANNTREFARYLMLSRDRRDELGEEADFYFLAKSNTRNTWFEPGPEWLVVVCSLLASRPRGQSTLGLLRQDLLVLGLQAERSVIVGMLEEAGLTSDSPDADDALIIDSGF